MMRELEAVMRSQWFQMKPMYYFIKKGMLKDKYKI
jgi:hypothetical protein